MQITEHLGISALLGAGLFFLTRSAPAALACFGAGVLIDADHFLDYLVNYGWRVDARHFLVSFRDAVFKRIFVLLHSWELVVLLVAVTWWNGAPPVLLGVSVGACCHMVLDQIVNGHHALAYFLLYRLGHRFDAMKFYGAEELCRRRALERGDGIPAADRLPGPC